MEISLELEKYIKENSTQESSLLKQIRKETYLKTTQPHMISGFVQGRFLSMISKMILPEKILEIGTFTGYATLCLAEGLKKDGKIITVDNNEKQSHFPRKFFELSEYKNKIIYILGNAMDVIPSLENNIDLVFLDADKQNYINYLEILKPKMKKGGFILADNILWKGKVLTDASDKKTKSIKDFNEYVNKDESLEVIILPVRDGISLIRKL